MTFKMSVTHFQMIQQKKVYMFGKTVETKLRVYRSSLYYSFKFSV